MTKRVFALVGLSGILLLAATSFFLTRSSTTQTFSSRVYHFRFDYPAQWNTQCCRMDGPLAATAQHLITIADTRTPAANRNGLAVFVDDNTARLPFDEYVAHEQDDLIAAQLGLGWRTFPIDTRTAFTPESGRLTAFVLGGQHGVLLERTTEPIQRIYIPLANSEILILAAPLHQSAEWDAALHQIFATFRFAEP